jgi:hypothetical protein
LLETSAAELLTAKVKQKVLEVPRRTYIPYLEEHGEGINIYIPAAARKTEKTWRSSASFLF